jgi:hypothetical protein
MGTDGGDTGSSDQRDVPAVPGKATPTVKLAARHSTGAGSSSGRPSRAIGASDMSSQAAAAAASENPKRRTLCRQPSAWREPLDHMMSACPLVSGGGTPALASETAR